MAAPWNDHLLTLEEYDELPEDNSRHYELHEGVLIVTPRAIPLRQKVAYHLQRALDAQLPYEWDTFYDVEVVLRSVFPPIVRAPDVVVVSAEAAEANPPRFTPDQVLLAVEVISPGSRNTDTITKPAEYAAAGIPHYWVIDPDPPLSLTAFHLAGDLGYQQAPAVVGRFTTSAPFPVDIDLTSLPILRSERRKKVDQ
jgi:Uma2 family endonuclease